MSATAGSADVTCPICDLVLTLPIHVQRSVEKNGTLLVDVTYDVTAIDRHLPEWHPVPDYVPDEL